MDTTETAVMELGLQESKAEEYILEHLFGTARGTAFYAILTGNATVESAVTAANLQAVGWLEAIALKALYPQLYAVLHQVGLA